MLDFRGWLRRARGTAGDRWLGRWHGVLDPKFQNFGASGGRGRTH